MPAISRDGARVYFDSPEQLTANPNGNGETAAEVSGEKLYVYNTDTQMLAFVAGEASHLQTTHDGEYLMFASIRAPLGTDDLSTVTQLFEYDATTGRVVRVSVGQRSPTGYLCPATETIEEGYNCNGNTNKAGNAPVVQQFSPFFVESPVFGFLGVSAQPQAAATNKAIAENGVIVFMSRLALTPRATPGAENAYEYRAGQLYLISPALASFNDLHGFEWPMTDESGTDVWFATLEQLVPQDGDLQSSIYDARTEGGYPASPPVASCSGEACQGPVPSPPSAASPLAAPGTNENFVPTKKSVAPKSATKKPSPTCKSKKASRTSGKASRTFCKPKAKPKSKARKASNYRRHGR